MVKNKLAAFTIFLGSFLIFGVQPMLGRTLLPAFGGTAAVWTTCLATYQVLLLVGYFYAHKVSRRKAKMGEHRTSNIERSTFNAQRLTSNDSGWKGIHIVLLALAVVWVLGFAWVRPWLMAHVGQGGFPALEVLLCVLAFVGLPYVLLSANSTLIQAWLVRGEKCANARMRDCATEAGEECANSGMRECENGAAVSAKHALPSEDNKAIRQSGNKAIPSDVYGLYAVSNAGSLLGLLCYPFLVEPFLSLDAQWYGFAGALGVYAALLAILARRIALLPYCLIALLKENHPSEDEGSDQADRSDRTDGTGVLGYRGTVGGAMEGSVAVPAASACGQDARAPLQASDARAASDALPSEAIPAFTHSRIRAFLWLLLPATSTFLLNAVTAHLSTDVTPIPLLWVALLAAFLVSYIIGFSKIGEKGVLVWCVLAMVPLLFCAYATGMKGGRGFLFNLVPGILLVLLGSTFLHSWLYRIRPEAERLTRFYLCLAAGGAAGGLVSGIVAPMVFTSVMEYPIALVLLALFYAFYAWKNTPKEFRWVETAVYLGAVVIIFFTFTGMNAVEPGIDTLQRQRNFYGCLTVSCQEFKSQHTDTVLAHRLQHGDTLHGMQFLPHYLRDKPTSYFGENGGGFGILNHPSYSKGAPMSVGVIGLGIGTLAAYGRTNDTYRFFEINPQVVDVAWNTNYFTYLSECKAAVSVALGDARRVITAETNRYDVLVIDAYSGDSIPFHLATKEAFRLYLDRLNPGGILAVHISNWHIDLSPLCKAVAKEWGLQKTGVVSQSKGLCTAACWVFMGDRHFSVQGLSMREIDWTQVRDIALPTDAKGSLINLVRYGYRMPEKPLELDLGEVLK